MRRWVWVVVLTGLAFGQAPPAGPPLASLPIEELKGKVERVRIQPGAGMPFLDVRAGETVTRVWLGAMRYLIEQNFNPKSGQAVWVRALRRDGDLLAIRITLPEERRTLVLRDEQGRPAWRHHRHGGSGGPCCR